MNFKSHNIARGVFIQDNKLLVCKGINKNNTFLIGGHIKIGEKAQTALKREIFEEIGCVAEIIRFLGVIEHKWSEGVNLNYETNFIFEIKINSCNSNENPLSRENHIVFFWTPIEQLNEIKLEPFPLIKTLSKSNIDCFWKSTY